MPADIRSFFGGGSKPAQASQKTEEPPAKKPATKKTGRASRVIEDSDDDEQQDLKPKKATPKKPPSKKANREPSPKLEETTTSAFFADSNKPKRAELLKKKSAEGAKATTAAPKGQPSKTVAPTKNGRSSVRARKPVVSYAQRDSEDEFPDDDLEDADDIFEDNINGRDKDNYKEESDSDNEVSVMLPHRGTPKTPAKQQQKKVTEKVKLDPEDDDIDMKDLGADDDLIEPSSDEQAAKSQSKKPSAASRKRKSPDLDDEEEESSDEETRTKTQRAKKAGSAKSPAKKRAKKEDAIESADIQAIYDSIPTVRAPTPPPKDPDAKFDWRANAGRAEPPPLQGSTGEMPSGSETCLAGLTFVFTGVLQRWGRSEAQELVKRHGGKVTGAPSKKTSYVILGTDAGPSKLAKIKEMGIKTIDEDGLTLLIEKLTEAGNKGDSKAQAAYKEKQRKEEEKIREQAAEMEREEKRRLKDLHTANTVDIDRSASTPAAAAAAAVAAAQSVGPIVDSRLWTTKYAPTSLSQICGNKATVEKIQRWLQRFPKNLKTGFKLGGPDGSGVFRAVMLHGPPGIGKTTAAHLVAKLEGYDIVERNASDTRSKKLIEDGLRGVLSTNSLHGYFAGDGKKIEASKKKLVLIMDEVDGMSAGDRGGVGALAAVCKKTEIPMILICNDRKLPKMKPFDFVTYDLPFRRPTVDQVRSRIMTIAFREGLKMPAPVVNALIEGSHADIRQVVNMISTAKLDQEAMDFDKGKQMSKSWEKHVILKPWDITQKILGGGMFAASSKATLNDKIELYFNDHEFSPLMLQENYLGTNPIQALTYSGREKSLKNLELASKAADSISDGDLVDRMIHGSQQQWSLMPTHAVFSFVRPASFVSGSTAGHGTRFTAWLGKNSSQNKLSRLIKEIQAHMRLRSSGDRHEVRQQYVPVLWTELVQKLQQQGKDAVPDVIELMDSYFLTKDDFDAIMELGVGPMDQEKVKIESQAKATFTRLYNQQSHPLPFMKASSVIAPKKQTKEKPDLEEAIEESDEGEIIEETREEEEDVDLSKDKYVKQPKKKAAPKKATSKKGKKEANDEASDEEEDVDVNPKAKVKARAKAPAKGKKK